MNPPLTLSFNKIANDILDLNVLLRNADIPTLLLLIEFINI